MSNTLRVALTATAVAVVLAACGKKEEAQQGQQAAAPGEEEKVLHVFNWSDYIAEDTIKNFEEKTGIKVTYDVFDSNDVLETRLLAGNSGFDVVVSSSSAFAKGVITKPGTLHVCYCHTPTRYLWSDTHSYVQELQAPRLVKAALPVSSTDSMFR